MPFQIDSQMQDGKELVEAPHLNENVSGKN